MVSAELGCNVCSDFENASKVGHMQIIYVPWMQIPFGLIKQLEVGLGRFKVVMLEVLAIKWGG